MSPHDEQRDRYRDEREAQRIDDQTRLLESRIRNLENEQSRIASILDKEQSLLRQTMAQYKEVIERNTLAVFGDGTDQREGLVNWKLNMDRRYLQIKTQVLSALSAVGLMILEFAREFLSHLLK